MRHQNDRILFLTDSIPQMGLMSGPIHRRIIDYLSGYFEVVCACYFDQREEFPVTLFKLPRRLWWWPMRPHRVVSYLRTKHLRDTLKLRPTDQIIVSYPFTGLDIARRLRKTDGIRYHVLVHDLHQGDLDKPEVQDSLRDATSLLCVSEAMVSTMKKYNPSSSLLYPVPGPALDLSPEFSDRPLALAGTLSPKNMEIITRFGLPVTVIGDAVKANDNRKTGPDIRFHPRFPENDDAVRFVSESCSALCVIIPRGKGAYETHSFPSKLIDFSRAGIPIVIVASPSSSAGAWARAREWKLYIDDEDDAQQFARVAADLRDRERWTAARDQTIFVRNGEFSAREINSTLLKVLRN